MKTELTIEQSQRLIELGVSVDKSSSSAIYDEPWHRAYYAVFTLADLLGILPKALRKDGMVNDYSLTMQWNKASYVWRVSYAATGDILGACDAYELIDALYGLIAFCIGNKYIEL